MTTLDLLSTKRAAAISVANNGTGVVETPPGTIVAVPLVQVLDNPYQPRGSYDPEHILKLAASIKSLKGNLPATMGLQQVPLARLVLRQHDGSLDVASRALYERGRAQRAIHEERNAAVELMFGHSRLRALMLLYDGLRYALKHKHIPIPFHSVPEVETVYAELLEPDADYATMPVVLGFALDYEMWTHAITENSQRKNITAIEEAQAMRRAMDEFGLTTEEAGKPFGYERSTASNKLRLLTLPAEARALVADGTLSERHGRELVRLAAHPERLKRALKRTTDKGLTVSELTNEINWQVKEVEQEAARRIELDAAREALAAEWCVPGQTAPVPVERVCDSFPSGVWPVGFDAGDSKDLAMLAGGHCGPHCACFVLYYRHSAGQVIGPDPERAPHVCVGCIGKHEERQAKRLAAANDAAAPLALTPAERERAEKDANRARITAERKAMAASVWQNALRQMDSAALWSKPGFWRIVARRTDYGALRILSAMTDVRSATDHLLTSLFESCDRYDSTVGGSAYKLDLVQELIAALGGDSTEYDGIEMVFEEEDEDAEP